MGTQYKGKLTPFLSTHFRCMETEKDEQGCEWLFSALLIKGKVYPILNWGTTSSPNFYQPAIRHHFTFKDEGGEIREWCDYWGIEDASYEGNLKRILE